MKNPREHWPPRQYWCSLKARFDQMVDPQGLKPGVIACLEDCNASTSMVLTHIIASEYADLFYPKVSMDTYVGVYSRKNWIQRNNWIYGDDPECYDNDGPNITFRALTGKRLLVAYYSPFRNATEDDHVIDVDQVPELSLTVGIVQLMEYLARMREETSHDA